MHKYDIVVVGGGINGIIAAYSLSKYVKKILLLDANNVADIPTIEKAIVLNHASLSFLNKIDFDLDNKKSFVLDRCNVSARGHLGRIRMSARDVNLPYLGRVFPYSSLFQDIFTKLKTATNVEIKSHAKVSYFDSQTREVIYQQNNNEYKVSASLVVGADGVDSSCRKFAEIDVTKSEVDYSSLVLQVKTQQNSHIAQQRFLQPGSVATIPTKNNEGTIIWTMPSNIIAQRQAQSSDKLLKLARDEIGKSGMVPTALRVPPVSYPVKLQQASLISKAGFVLIGAAAINILPITAQGLNLAIRDIDCLVRLMRLNNNFWDDKIANEYVRLRRPDHDFCYKQVLCLQKIFMQDSCILNLIRSSGLSIASKMAWCSDFIALRGAGYFNYGSFDI